MKIALNPEIWAENRENFNKVGDVSDQETEEQNAGHVRMCLRKCVMTPWRHEYLMSSKTGNVFRR